MQKGEMFGLKINKKKQYNVMEMGFNERINEYVYDNNGNMIKCYSFYIGQNMGKGAFSACYSVEDLFYNIDYAAKITRKEILVTVE